MKVGLFTVLAGGRAGRWPYGGRGNVTQSHRIWTLNKGSNVSSPVLYRGHLYFLHENLGIAYCVEALSGKVVYEERLPNAGQFYGSPVVAGGRIYAFTRNGRGFVLSAKPQFELLGRNELSDRSSFDASPAVDADRILLRSDKYLYAFRKAGFPLVLCPFLMGPLWTAGKCERPAIGTGGWSTGPSTAIRIPVPATAIYGPSRISRTLSC